ncbi:MAG: hypothetical protein B6U65_01275 [Candidatus Wolframiiraptor sp. EX4484-121]|nr:MAG: hypothetical protein B6U65_01275 [Candidatus Wolframiiraptor sp. EX4484-121]
MMGLRHLRRPGLGRRGMSRSEAPWFGASRHVANAVLTAMKFDPRIRSAMNLRYDKRLIEAAEKLGWTVSFYDRREEPEEIKRLEGRTVPWGIEVAVRRVGGRVPDLVYHLGDWGKEPMTLVFGRDSMDVVDKVRRLVAEASR